MICLEQVLSIGISSLTHTYKKSFEKRYKNDLPHSKWIYYYPNSNYIQKEENYSEGLKDGAFKEFYFGDRLSRLYTYDNNLIKGEYQEFLPSGETSVSGYYTNNLKDSIWETYREDGSVFSIGKYKNDLKEGDWKYFQECLALGEQQIHGRDASTHTISA